MILAIGKRNTMNRDRNCLLPLLMSTCLLLFTQATLANTAAEAEAIVKNTTDRVIQRLNEDRTELQANPDRIYKLVNELIIPHFDFASMSKWVLGKSNWKAATPEQKKRFINEFQTLLIKTYAKALLEYSNNEIVFLPSDKKPNSKLVRVNTEVIQTGGAKPIPINYTMYAGSGTWKVVDINVDGISLVSTYRGSFSSEINKNGMDALINKLVQRNSGLADASTSN